MKRILNAALAAMLGLSLYGCAETNPETEEENKADAETQVPEETAETVNEKEGEIKAKILVAYFSATGTTEGIAEKIAEITGGDLYEIEPAEPYTEEDLNYNDSSTRATVEQHDSDSRPEIAGVMENFEDYDTVFLGYPIWWGDAAHIMFTFAEACDFEGKTVIPFCTSGGSSIGSSAEHIESHANGGIWLEGKRMSGSTTEQEIREWISSLEINTTEDNEMGMEEDRMRITVKNEDIEIIYELNDSKAAESLYAQLPLTLEEEDFSSNEKTFYPPEKLDVSGTPLAEGGAGILAYYEPWGDVVMFYGDFGGNSSLYALGTAVTGTENISRISGTVEISRAE